MKAPANEKPCCPRFDPAPWQDRNMTWTDKRFIKETVPQLFHIPLPGTFGRAVTRMSKKIEAAGATPDPSDFLMLASESSMWRGEIYLSATKEVPDADNVKLSGLYLTKVFDGGYNDVPKWIKEMTPWVAATGKAVKKWFFYYTTCPRCAKKWGHNYVVAFAEVREA